MGSVPITESMMNPTKAGDKKEKATPPVMAATQPQKYFQLPSIISQMKPPLLLERVPVYSFFSICSPPPTVVSR